MHSPRLRGTSVLSWRSSDGQVRVLGVGDVIQHALVHVTPARIDTSMAPCTACAPAGDAGIDF